MSFTIRQTRRVTRIHLTGKDANDFVNSLIKPNAEPLPEPEVNIKEEPVAPQSNGGSA